MTYLWHPSGKLNFEEDCTADFAMDLAADQVDGHFCNFSCGGLVRSRESATRAENDH